MNFSLYKSQQKPEIINLFQNTFSDSEGSEEGTVIGKLVSDFLSQPLQMIFSCLSHVMTTNALSAASFSPSSHFLMRKTCFFSRQ